MPTAPGPALSIVTGRNGSKQKRHALFHLLLLDARRLKSAFWLRGEVEWDSFPEPVKPRLTSEAVFWLE
jgi:hypothetical protein